MVDRTGELEGARHDQIVMMLFFTQAMVVEYHEPGALAAWVLVGVGAVSYVAGAVGRWLRRKSHG